MYRDEICDRHWCKLSQLGGAIKLYGLSVCDWYSVCQWPVRLSEGLLGCQLIWPQRVANIYFGEIECYQNVNM